MLHYTPSLSSFYQERFATENCVGAATYRCQSRDRSPLQLAKALKYSAEELTEALKAYTLSPHDMTKLGYPIQMEPTSWKAVVYINQPPRPKPLPVTAWDVNAPEFMPGSQYDSGRESWGSTPRFDTYLCARCDVKFRMTPDGKMDNKEPCLYHWGRLNRYYRYQCCELLWGSKGCTMAFCHVWSGTRPGMNGPFDGYVSARSLRGGVYALDTEMSYTTGGLELTSVAVIAIDGRVIYQTHVKTSSPVVDYNTRFSGIRPRDLARATKTLRDVQNDILEFVGTDTILVGHGLENDLRAIKLLHGAVIDTCALYPHARGFPMRRSLRALSEEFLGCVIQRGESGHSPAEDARAAMMLVLRKVDEDRENLILKPG